VWERRVERERGRRDGVKKVLGEYGYEFEVPTVEGVEKMGSREERKKLAEKEGGREDVTAAIGSVETQELETAKVTNVEDGKVPLKKEKSRKRKTKG